MVYLTVGQNTQESTVRVNTTEPKWEENFRFLITSPYHQNLDLEVNDFLFLYYCTQSKILSTISCDLMLLLKLNVMGGSNYITKSLLCLSS